MVGESDRQGSGQSEAGRGVDPTGQRDVGTGESPDAETHGVAQDLVARALAAGLSGLFSTQEAVRKALGDAMPEEWAEYVSQQGERARGEFFDRMSSQMSALLDNMDINEFMAKLMEDHEVEVTARFRLRPVDRGAAERTYQVSVSSAEKKEGGD